MHADNSITNLRRHGCQWYWVSASLANRRNESGGLSSVAGSCSYSAVVISILRHMYVRTYCNASGQVCTLLAEDYLKTTAWRDEEQVIHSFIRSIHSLANMLVRRHLTNSFANNNNNNNNTEVENKQSNEKNKIMSWKRNSFGITTLVMWCSRRWK